MWPHWDKGETDLLNTVLLLTSPHRHTHFLIPTHFSSTSGS